MKKFSEAQRKKALEVFIEATHKLKPFQKEKSIDGTKKGPNIKDTIDLSNKIKIPFVVSGGIASVEDIKKIKSLKNTNIEGVIIGKSIYDGDIKLKELAKQI